MPAPITKMQFIDSIRELDPATRWKRYCDVDDRLTAMRISPDFDYGSKAHDDLMVEHECYWIALTEDERRRTRA
jgi:hypothetical protein